MRRVVFVGAAGRDVDAFNLPLRADASTQAVAFTGAPIPRISGTQAVGGVVDAYPGPSHLDFELEEIASPTMADAPPDGKELQ